MRLIVCGQCQTENKLSSRFCAECGREIADADRLATRAENDKLVADGRRSLGEGRIEEAQMIAKTVLDVDPDSLSALLLLGDTSEKLSQYDQAVESYELALKLKPDSPLERIRLAHLRKLAAQQEIAFQEPQSKRQTIWAAVAVAFLLICVGSALLLASQPQTTKALAKNDTASDETINAFNVPPPVPSGPLRPNGDQAPTTAADVQAGTAAATGGAMTRKAFAGSSGIADREGNVSVQPMSPGNLGSGPVTDVTNKTPSLPKTSDPTPDQPKDPATTPDATTAPSKSDPKENPGIIDIKPSSGKSSTDGDPSEDPDNLIRAARDFYAQGNYAKALEIYQKALRAGASPGSTNQRMAQCYEKLGRTAEAISAYKRAIQAYENQGKSARTDRAIESCRKAIQVLGG